jgi:Fic family protein
MTASRQPSPQPAGKAAAGIAIVPERAARRPGGWAAGIADPFLPALDIDRALVQTLAEAERVLGRLAGMAAMHPNPWMPVRALMRREAVLSCRLEGARASLADLARLEVSPADDRGDTDAREAANCLRALNDGLKQARRKRVATRLLRDLHRTLMKGMRRRDLIPGDLRNARTPPDPPGCMLVYLDPAPPPPRVMRAGLSALEAHLRGPSTLSPLVRLALVHARFLTLQPFLHRNGQVGRLLVSLLLYRWGLIGPPLLTLSAHFARHGARFDDRLLAAIQEGDWGGWVGFFLAGVADQSRDVIRRALRVRRVREDYLARLHPHARPATPVRDLVERLFECPATTVPAAARLLKIERRAAAHEIGRLADLGILSADSAHESRSVFLAGGIIRAIEDDLKPAPSARVASGNE